MAPWRAWIPSLPASTEADPLGVDVVLAEVLEGDGPAEALRDRLLCAAGRGSVPTD
jgi:L-threonylcarbamoyladenylate synthase